MGIAKKVRMLLLEREMKLSELAILMNPPTSVQNLSKKLSRDNLSEKDVATIATA